MNALLVLVAILFIAGVIAIAYAVRKPRSAPPREEAAAPLEPLKADTGWTSEAGAEFAGLPEAARCDLIFAVDALDDERSQRLLVHALDDPSDAVALAAAHALARRGRADAVNEYAARHPGERAQRILETLLLLG